MMNGPALPSNPFLSMALDLILKLNPEAKLAIVETIANSLQVRPGFWDPASKPPENVPCLVELEGLSYVVAHYNGTEWRKWAIGAGATSNETIAQPVKRWAVIPS